MNAYYPRLNERLTSLEEAFDMDAASLRITVERVAWLISVVMESATPEQVDALQVAELLAIADTADHGCGQAQKIAQESLEREGLTFRESDVPKE